MKKIIYISILILALLLITGATYITNTYIKVDELRPDTVNTINVSQNFNVIGNLTGNIYHAEMWNYSSNASAWTFGIASAGTYYNLTGLANGVHDDFKFIHNPQTTGGSHFQALHAGSYLVSFSMSSVSFVLPGEIQSFLPLHTNFFRNCQGILVTGKCSIRFT